MNLLAITVKTTERRNALVEAIQNEFGSDLEVRGSEAGMHLVVRMTARVRERQIVERAAREKLWLWPLSPCYLNKNPQPGLILGFGSTSPKEMPKRVQQLRRVIEV